MGDNTNSGGKRKVGAHITRAQKLRLQQVMAERPLLRQAKFSQNFSAKDAAKAWTEIAVELNAIPGARKDWKAWRKTWQDIQSKAKAKQAELNRSLRQTGGGPPPPPLNDFEQSVVGLMNPRVVSGHEESQESTVHFDFPQVPQLDMADDEEVVVYQIESEETENLTPAASTSRRPTKINMKSLLKEKVEIKKKYYDEKIKVLKEHNQILNDINLTLKTIGNNLQPQR